MQLFDIMGHKILLPEDEAKNLQALLSQMSDPGSVFSTIDVDENGLITNFAPPPLKTTWGFIFLIQRLMISQRLYLMDSFLKTNGVIK